MYRDIEAILVRVLGGVTERVSTVHPRDTNDPWIKVQVLGASDVTGAERPIDRLVEYMVQVDCYAGDRDSSTVAQSLAAQVRAALVAMDGATLDGAVFSRVRITQGPARIADVAFQPARERYIVTAIFRAR